MWLTFDASTVNYFLDFHLEIVGQHLWSLCIGNMCGSLKKNRIKFSSQGIGKYLQKIPKSAMAYEVKMSSGQNEMLI